MVKVVYVIDDLGLGGAQRQLVELVKSLSKVRYDPHVISLSTTKTDYAEPIRSAGIPLRQIPQSGKWDQRCFRTLLKSFREIKPRLVHTWLFTADLYGRLAAWAARVPGIVTAVRSVEPWKPWHYVAADRLLCWVTDAFTVNARAVGEILAAREHVDRRKIYTVYNGIDLRAFDPARTDGVVRGRIGVGQGAPLIGIVGRLAPEKDHETFLKAAGLVSNQIPQVNFLVVGSGPLQDKLQRLRGALSLEKQVHFLPNQSDRAQLFAALDLVVVSSRYEGCSNVILEAMAMGKPVIATAVGGNPELILPGQTGLLVPPQDPEGLAEAMMELVRDPDRAQGMGRQGRRRVEEQFGLERMVDETDRFYQGLLDRCRR